MSDISDNRDHLFISYATEDGALAEWLTLKLLSEGYKVWCDRKKLLGGESYPRDIDEAIKNRSFRLIALLSHASLKKPNPSKERTLALNISRELKIDFLIPLNLTHIRPTELDWMTSDLSYIDFHNWADGFSALLKKLSSINAPRDLLSGRISVCQWFDSTASPIRKQEKLWSNVFPINQIPSILNQYEISKQDKLTEAIKTWAFYKQTPTIVWAFTPPPASLFLDTVKKESIEWQKITVVNGINLKNAVSNIIYRSIILYCISKGLAQTSDFKKVYFPLNVLENDNIRFINYTGKKSFIQTTGIRTFYKTGIREPVRYHLSPSFKPKLWDTKEPYVIISIGLVLTTSDGNPLEPAKTISRRKKLCKNWWNHQWLSRLFAISSWLSDGKSEIELCTTENGSLSIAAISTCVTVDYGINESSKNSLEQINSDDNCIDIIDIDELEENLDIIEEDEIDE